MAIKFTPATLASAAERKTYDQIQTLTPSPRYNHGTDTSWSSWDETKNNSGKDLISCMSYEAGYGSLYVSCVFNPKGVANIFNHDAGATRLDIWRTPNSKQVLEARYGDIDNDGDTDIAVKLTDGAIYVFHNLSK